MLHSRPAGNNSCTVVANSRWKTPDAWLCCFFASDVWNASFKLLLLLHLSSITGELSSQSFAGTLVGWRHNRAIDSTWGIAAGWTGGDWKKGAFVLIQWLCLWAETFAGTFLHLCGFICMSGCKHESVSGCIAVGVDKQSADSGGQLRLWPLLVKQTPQAAAQSHTNSFFDFSEHTFTFSLKGPL